MRTSTLARFVRSKSNSVAYVIALGVAVFFISIVPFAQPPDDPDLKVMKVGLGSGTVTSDPSNPGINCGADCDQGYAGTAIVTLTATAAAGSRLTRWDGDCSATPSTTNSCTVSMSSARSVRVEFSLDPDITPLTEAELTPAGIRAYLAANLNVNSPARFIRALPSDYKQNWILMSRSESLQTGTADSPRILLPGANFQNVFTVGMTQSSSYPGAHPNAIEYMQWDPAQKNFRFHEIVLANIGEMGDTITLPDSTTVKTFPARPRGIAEDDAKCSKCHSTRNVLNVDRTVFPAIRGSLAGTDGIAPNPFTHKNKPNWDTYDSWGGMLPFNRDRIYQGSVEAAAFRKIFNLWNWRTNEPVRSIIEQLELQNTPAADRIARESGGPNDGQIRFAFDPATTPVSEPFPSGSSTSPVTYEFNREVGTSSSSVTQGGSFITLHHSGTPTLEEGRAVQFFDIIGGFDGELNQQRIVDELTRHRFAPGSVPIDVRPVALAIVKGCLSRSGAGVTPALAGGLGFFTARHDGLTIEQIFNDTLVRSQSIPRRKADIQRLNLDKTNPNGSVDVYMDAQTVSTPFGLIHQYGAATDGISGGSGGLDTTLPRLRQEVFRRPTTGFSPDETVMDGVYIDREDYTVGDFNTEKVALYRYFLEPLGVSVDKWSMGVRGRSRTYTFADVFKLSRYTNTFTTGLETSLDTDRFPGLTPPFTCTNLMTAVNASFAGLPSDGIGAVPTYTDVQRIFNKSCIECHGGLLYPPYRNYVFALPDPADPPDPANPFEEDEHLDLSEEEYPTVGGRRRMRRSFENAVARTTTSPPENSLIYQRIIDTSEDCPYGLMPCGGPQLSQADIKTVLRWIDAGGMMLTYSEGDPHIRTIDGVNYDFQSAGEFVLLRGENLEIQARQTPVETGSPLGPNGHTGLRSCVSLNGAVAVQIGRHRITYQPNLSGQPDPSGLQLRIDGKQSTITSEGIPLTSGVRIMPTTAPGGIRIEAPGGTAVLVTPNWWDHRQLWYMNIDVRRPRASEGVMGAIAPGSWLPALPDGTSLGPKPIEDLHQRYVDLYEKFESAWRVTDATSLFDYAPGTSTSTFSIESWPTENPQVCQLPPRPEAPPAKRPLQALTLEVAQQHCNGIAAADRRENCVQDVMVTGEPQFAKTYLLTEQIESNKAPTVPVLGYPDDYKNNRTDLVLPIDFTWTPVTDPDGDVVTYRHCVWGLGERPNNNKCVATTVQTASWRRQGVLWSLLVLVLVCLLLLILLIFIGKRRKPILLILLAVAIMASVILAFYIRRARTGSESVAKTVSGLKPGKEYFWKVIVEDGKGGITESVTRRFKTK